jgi:AcrR family transcriptional regulator
MTEKARQVAEMDVNRQTDRGWAPNRASRNRTSKSATKRRRILEAAATVFSQRGYAQATLAEIAALAGTQAGSLYYYYKNRDHLVVDLLNYAVLQMEENALVALAALPRESTARDRFLTLIRTHVLSALELDAFALASRKIAGQVSDEIRAQVGMGPRRYAYKWREVVDEAVEEGFLRHDIDRRLLRLIIVGAVAYMPDWYKRRGPSSPDEIANFLIDILLRGAAAA